MALIILDEGERFEHYHTDKSQTILIDGTAVMEIGSDIIKLKRDVAVDVDENIPHTLVNTGSGKATIGCIHTEIVRLGG